MKKLGLLVAWFLVLFGSAYAAPTINPCVDSRIVLTQAAINVSAAGTTALITATGTSNVYVCSVQFLLVSGTTPTAQFEFGTGATCTGGTTLLTGTLGIATVNTALYTLRTEGTLWTVGNNNVCLIAGGTTPNIQGTITYVQAAN